MAYTTGGTIQFIDYNYLAWGGNTAGVYSPTITNLAYIWGTGSGWRGYGQDVSLLTPGTLNSVVTAAQWAGLVYNLNRALGHQSGAAAQLATGSNIGITPGATIQAFANVATAVATVNTNANLKSALGTTIIGSIFNENINFVGGSANVQSFSSLRTVTFAGGGNAARYFFNAGGQIRLSFVGGTNVNGTARSNDFIELFHGNIGNVVISAASSIGICGGSRGNVKSNVTTLGYYTLTTTSQIIANVQSAGSIYTYKTDYANVFINTSTPNAAGLFDNGTTLTFRYNCTDGAAQTNSNFNDAVQATLFTRVDIIQPETTYLAHVWGVIGIT